MHTTRSRRHTATLGAALTAVLALALTACNGDDGSTDGADRPNSSAPATASSGASGPAEPTHTATTGGAGDTAPSGTATPGSNASPATGGDTSDAYAGVEEHRNENRR
ncbi:hypothetical protein ACFVW8_12345 [Streptomyces sp. NPDC058221]|uniref:hypothetical protein n=1 Tax=Streptomyces sp. NPDC058221 TaxID=3346388 RepID=UPI0036EF1F27